MNQSHDLPYFLVNWILILRHQQQRPRTVGPLCLCCRVQGKAELFPLPRREVHLQFQISSSSVIVIGQSEEDEATNMVDNNNKGFVTSTDVESWEADEEIMFDVDQSHRSQLGMACQTILGIALFALLPSFVYLLFLGIPNGVAIVCVAVEAVATVSLIWPILVLFQSRLLSVSLSSRGISCRQQTYNCCCCSRSSPKIKSCVSEKEHEYFLLISWEILQRANFCSFW